MSHYAVWLDSENARLFNFLNGTVETNHIVRHEPDHHTHNARDVPKDSEHFFHQVCEKLTGASHVLLLGQALARTHFQSHLTNHHHGELAKKVVGSETTDHLTDKQLEAFARNFFKEHNLAV